MEICRPRLRTHNDLALHLRRGLSGPLRGIEGRGFAGEGGGGRRRVRRRPRFVLRGDYHGRSGRLGQRPVVGLWRGLRRLPSALGGRSASKRVIRHGRSRTVRLGRGLRRLPASGGRLASLRLVRHGRSRTVRLGRGLRRLPALRGRSASKRVIRHQCSRTVRLGRGLRRLPALRGRSASKRAIRHGRSRTVRLGRGLRRLPSALGGRSGFLSAAQFATGAVEPSASGAGCDVSPALGDRSASKRVIRHGRSRTVRLGRGLRRLPAFARPIGFQARHSPPVQSNRPPAARVATSPVRFGRPIGFQACHSPRAQSNRPPRARVATSPRFGRPIGFLGTYSPPSATVARAGLSSSTAPAIFPVRVVVGRSRGLADSVSSRSRPPRARARC